MKKSIKYRIAKLLVAGLILGTMGIHAGFSKAETTGRDDSRLYPAAASATPSASARASGSPTASASARPTASATASPSATPVSDLKPVAYISDKEAKDASSFNTSNSKTDGWFMTDDSSKLLYLNYRVSTPVTASDNVTLELEAVNSLGKKVNIESSTVKFTGQYYSRSLSIKYANKEEDS